MIGLLARARGLWRGISRRRRFDTEMDEEMLFHIEMHTERLIREQGLEPDEARRRAYVAFGGLDKYKEEGRDVRGLRWLDAISLDCRLGVRMLAKYPGLTVIGSFAIAVAIAIVALSFEVITVVMHSVLPIEDGERVVAIQYATGQIGNPERRVLHDFIEWRNELRSLQQVSAFRSVEHNLVSADGHSEPISVAEMTASGFIVARTPPLLGRYLVADDEREGAQPVVVIGHDQWRARFGSDPHIVGQTIKLGAVPHIVIGVMPERFRFPVDHEYWMALRANPSKSERLRGPELHVFGRLAPGISFEQAQAELTAIGRRTAAAYPETYAQLRPVVVPYTREHVDVDHPVVAWSLWILQLLITGLLLIVAVNVAILVYARTLTRLGEIAVRSALGASRRRILAQLFIEACALSGVGGVAGLVSAHFALRWMQTFLSSVETVPFWIDFQLSIATAIYGVGLVALAAAMVGVVPGLKTTRHDLHANLKELSGGHGARLGRTWTALVVAQVAIAVAILPLATFTAWEVMRMEFSAAEEVPADHFLLAELELDNETTAITVAETNRRGFLRLRQLELMSRLEAEPNVSAVTFSSAIPGFEPGRHILFTRDVEVVEANYVSVGLAMFEAYGAKILAGRTFEPGDLNDTANAVVVSRTFAEKFLGPGHSALGRRFQYATSRASLSNAQRQPKWYEIVGIVNDFPAFPPQPGRDREPTIYHPAAPGALDSIVFTVRLTGIDPADFIRRFRQIGSEVAPTMPLHDVKPLMQYYEELRSLWRAIAWALALVTCSVVLLSAAGLYALLSFTVSQRTREIGIRTALGAHPRRILAAIFTRVLRQVGLGLIIGLVLSAGALLVITDLSFEDAAALLLTVVVIITLVGLFAAVGPARRGLDIQATDALKAD